jgi:polyisoprenoid-binding protein YceI
MSRARSGALLVLLIVAWSMAHQARGQATDTAIAIDAGQSSARFVVHTRISIRAEGRMPQVSGELLGTPAGGWQVLVYVDGRGLQFDGPRWMERITRSDAFLAVDRHPEIHFHSEKFADAALRDGGPLHGELTLRGQKRPVSFELLPSTCARPGLDCDIQVHGAISRHAFGMNAYRTLVKDDVDFNIRVRLQAGAPPS